VRFGRERRAALGDVEERRDDEARRQRRDEREHPRDAERAPRREEEPDRERDLERPDVAGAVHGQPRIRSEDERGEGDDELHERDRRQHDPEGPDVGQRAARRGRARSDRDKHRVTEVGDFGRGRESHQPVQPLGFFHEGAAVCARVEVGAEHAVVETGILAVETGGERIAKPDARHGPVVDSKPEMVPPVSSVAVDELTRLFLAARDGDRAALLAAIRTSQADIWRLAAHLVDPSEADDVTQDTFVRAWQALPAFRGDASARTWLLSIARRACADAVRRRSRSRRLVERLRGEAHDDQPDGHAHEDPLARSALFELVEQLDGNQRSAFVLTQIVGCSYSEAAEVCDVPVGTIRSRVARARNRLLAQLRAAETA
jgi:RNA polymerase sigma-70 factor, ECF subfamily